MQLFVNCHLHGLLWVTLVLFFFPFNYTVRKGEAEVVLGTGLAAPANRDELWSHVFLLQKTKPVGDLIARLGLAAVTDSAVISDLLLELRPRQDCCNEAVDEPPGLAFLLCPTGS